MEYEKTWKKLLIEGEKIEYQFSIGNLYTTTCLIIWGIISLIFVFSNSRIGILFFIIMAIYYKFYLPISNAYAFTNKRVLIHRGWLSTNTKSVDYSKITDIHIVEPFIDRIIFHTGHIAIITAGSTNAQIVLKNIESPYEVKKKLDTLRDL